MNVIELKVPSAVAFRFITEDLERSKMRAKLMPKVLSGDQKSNRAEISSKLSQCVENDLNYLD